MPRVAGLLGGLCVPICLLLSIELWIDVQTSSLVFAIIPLAETLLVLVLALNIVLLLRCWWEWRPPVTTVVLIVGSAIACLSSFTIVILLYYYNNSWLSVRAIMCSLLMLLSTSAFGWVSMRGKAELMEPFRAYSSQSGRGFTEYQAQLVVVTIAFVWYTIAGAFLFSYALENGWTFEDGVYFAISTLTTIGLGDLTVKTPAGRSILPIYSIFGLSLFAMLIYSIRQVILEFLAVRLSVQLYRLLSAWAVNQEIELIANDSASNEEEFFVDSNFWSSDEEKAATRRLLAQTRQQQHANGQKKSETKSDSSEQSKQQLPMHRAATIAIGPDAPISREWLQAADEYHSRTISTISTGTPRLRIASVRPPSMGTSLSIVTPLPLPTEQLESILTPPLSPQALLGPSDLASSEADKRNQQRLLFRTLRSILLRHLKYSLITVTAYMMAFGYVMSRLEKWTLVDGWYFAFTCLTSIGYGDLVPKTFQGRNAYLGFVSVGMGIMTIVASLLAEFLMSQWKIHVEAIMN